MHILRHTGHVNYYTLFPSGHRLHSTPTTHKQKVYYPTEVSLPEDNSTEIYPTCMSPAHALWKGG